MSKGKDLIEGLISLKDISPQGYYEYSLGKRSNIVLFSPKLIYMALVKHEKSFSRGLTFLKMKNFFGNGLITSEDPDHMTNKRIIQKDFHVNRLVNYISIIYKNAEECLGSMNNKTTSLTQTADRFSFNNVSECLFGETTPEEYINIYHEVSDMVANTSGIYLLDKEKIDFYKIESFLTELVKNKQPKGDLLSHMINSGMEERQIVEECIVLLGAGFETTGALICWSLINILNNEEILNRIRKETPNWIIENRVPTYEEVFESETINNSIKETLRTNPPGYFSNRTAKTDIDLSGALIKSGSNVYVSQYVSHRDEKYFDNPNEWNPDRWLNDFEKSIPRGAYFPFGMGTKRCVGEHFAMLMVTMFVSMILFKYDIDIIDKNTEPEYLISMVPSGPVNIIIKNR